MAPRDLIQNPFYESGSSEMNAKQPHRALPEVPALIQSYYMMFLVGCYRPYDPMVLNACGK